MAVRFEAIAIRVEAMASRLEAISSRLVLKLGRVGSSCKT